jgi:ribonucleoside-diphosphate reductase alpha chain
VAREPLPDRRRSWTQKVHIPDATGQPQTFYLCVGEYPDGRPGEVWIDAHKEGTFTRGVLSALARMVSIALQSGVGLAEVCDTLRHLNFPPRGPVEGSAFVASCASVPDWIAAELEAAYLKPVAPPPEKVAGYRPEEWRSGT